MEKPPCCTKPQKSVFRGSRNCRATMNALCLYSQDPLHQSSLWNENWGLNQKFESWNCHSYIRLILDMWHFLAEPNFLCISNSNGNAFLLESAIIKYPQVFCHPFEFDQRISALHLFHWSINICYNTSWNTLYFTVSLEKGENGQKEKFSCNPISSLSKLTFWKLLFH